MNIVSNLKNSTKSFNTLKIGDCFSSEAKQTVFMKSEEYTYRDVHDRPVKVNAIDLRSGGGRLFAATDEVTHLACTLSVERIYARED